MDFKDQKRREKLERRAKERAAHSRVQTTHSFRNRLLAVGVGMALLVGVLVLWNSGAFATRPHPYDAFAQCLTENDVTMYGTDWCPYCQKQKKIFDRAFRYIDYVNCDFNQQLCKQKKVEGYPTWHYQGRFWETGVKTFYEFSELTGCPVPDHDSSF